MGVAGLKNLRRRIPGGPQVTPTTFPSLIYLLHMDDALAGATTWNPRVGTMAINSTVAYSKDVDGVYVASTATITPNGAMPVIPIGKYIMNLTVGTPANDVHAVVGNLGDSSIGDALMGNGSVFFDTAQYVVAHTANVGGTYPTGMEQCHLTFSDWKNSGGTDFRILAPAAGQAGMTAGGNATVTTAPVSIGRNSSFPSAVSVNGFNATINIQRLVLWAIFVFDSPFTYAQCATMAEWMANNKGLLHSGLRA